MDDAAPHRLAGYGEHRWDVAASITAAVGTRHGIPAHLPGQKPVLALLVNSDRTFVRAAPGIAEAFLADR